MSANVDVGTTRQLFIDDHLIEETRGIKKTLHQPAKYAGNPLMYPLYPWEGRLELYGTVWRDESGDWRMWYMGMGDLGISPMGSENTSKWAHIGFDPAHLLYSFCYATSKDGIFWKRPNLGLEEYDGSKDTNIVLKNASAANVIRDERDPDPNRLYKSLFYESRDPDGTSNEGDGVSVAFSPDGIKWTKYEGNPVITRASDSHTLLGWDELHGKYVAYCRPSIHEGNMIRRIGRCVSDDFVNWSDPEDVLSPDENDPPGLQLYNMPVFKYEGMYIGQLLGYHCYSEERHIRFYGKVDVQLTCSRDGLNWNRVSDSDRNTDSGRKPFIPNGPPNSIDSGEIYMANAPVVLNDELWFYYCSCATEHGPTGRTGPINLAKLRLDGFVSVDAGEEVGTLITKPFLCEGGLLRINATARGGNIRMSVIDEEGTEQEGFGAYVSSVFDSDALRQEMTWRRGSFDALKGKVIRLKFYLQNAELYSFSQGN